MSGRRLVRLFGKEDGRNSNEAGAEADLAGVVRGRAGQKGVASPEPVVRRGPGLGRIQAGRSGRWPCSQAVRAAVSKVAMNS